MHRSRRVGAHTQGTSWGEGAAVSRLCARRQDATGGRGVHPCGDIKVRRGLGNFLTFFRVTWAAIDQVLEVLPTKILRLHADVEADGVHQVGLPCGDRAGVSGDARERATVCGGSTPAPFGPITEVKSLKGPITWRPP